MEDGRKMYEAHVSRPRVTGGARKSTQKRYKAVFDKFVPFAASLGVTVWNGVTVAVLNKYAADLESQGYAHKTQLNELITLKQAIKWLIQAGHLQGTKPIELKLRKAESDRAYCYQPGEVKAMVEHCRVSDSLHWLGDIIIALACTGLRISELASLRWSDFDLATDRLKLTDETGRAKKTGVAGRELKSGRSRSFPIHPDLRTVIDHLPHVDAYAFHGPRGGRVKPDTIRNVLVREVIKPLAEKFSKQDEEKQFKDGRLHSFRHYFCSTCANSGVPELMVREWLGHRDSEMLRHYYHLHDDEARSRMKGLDFLGGAGRRSADQAEQVVKREEVVEPMTPEGEAEQ